MKPPKKRRLIQILYFIDNVCVAYFLMELLNHENINQVCLMFFFTVYICKMTLRNCNAYIESKVHILVPFYFVHIHITLYINNCIVKMTQVFTCIIYFI